MATKRKSAEAAEHVLELVSGDGEKPRRTVSIDGAKYELRWIEEFSFQERLKFTRQIAKLQRVSSMDAEQYAELDNKVIVDASNAVNASVKAVLIGLKDAKLAKLNFDQKMRILEVFNPAAETKGETSEAAESDSPTGTQPYRMSSDSTEEASAIG